MPHYHQPHKEDGNIPTIDKYMHQLFVQFTPGHNAYVQPQQQQTYGQPVHGQHQVIDPNLASIISGAFQAAILSMQHNQGVANNAGGLQTSSKSAKLLNGTNRFSLLGFCGLMIHDEVPDIFKILDSNEDPTAKFQALKDLLTTAQHENALINFTLWKETVKDIKQHLFQLNSNEKNMTQGCTPFCLQKMNKGSEIALCQLEECMECTTYTSVMDLTKWDQS